MTMRHAWYRPRRYIHFDRPVGLKQAERVATNPKCVAHHAFYPFIGYRLISKKLKHDKLSGKLEKTEKLRPIGYAAHLDAHIYSYYAYLLGRLYETAIETLGIGNSVLAFRPLGKSNVDFAEQVFRVIEKRGECSVLALDISKFFDCLDHHILKEHWARLLGATTLPDDHFAVYKSLTQYSIVNRDDAYSELGISKHNPKKGRVRLCSTDEFRLRIRGSGLISRNSEPRGIPQGSPLSALLSNIYMLEFDTVITKRMAHVGGVYYRYCDDMLFIVPYGEKKTTFDFAVTEIAKLTLVINEKKTETHDFHVRKDGLSSQKPLQYLGFLYDGKRKLIRSSALARYSEQMKRGVRLAKLTKIKRNRARIARGDAPRELFKRKLYERYSHLGKRNFIRYGLRAAEIMESDEIRAQLKPLWNRLQEEIKKK